MISSRYKFIFLHVPKTAGNAVQSYLLPFSDDRKLVHQHQDGVERFDIRGEITPTKHAMLQGYFDALGDGLGAYSVVMPIRDPVDRALSLYFSPHRGVGKSPGFTPAFEIGQFAALVRDMPAMVDYLRVQGSVQAPRFVLRFDHLRADLDRVAEALGLPVPELPILNRSLDREGKRALLRLDPAVTGLVGARFAEDYAYFGFKGAASPPGAAS